MARTIFIIALLLAGCFGSGGDTSNEPIDPEQPTLDPGSPIEPFNGTIPNEFEFVDCESIEFLGGYRQQAGFHYAAPDGWGRSLEVAVAYTGLGMQCQEFLAGNQSLGSGNLFLDGHTNISDEQDKLPYGYDGLSRVVAGYTNNSMLEKSLASYGVGIRNLSASSTNDIATTTTRSITFASGGQIACQVNAIEEASNRQTYIFSFYLGENETHHHVAYFSYRPVQDLGLGTTILTAEEPFIIREEGSAFPASCNAWIAGDGTMRIGSYPR